MRSSPGPVDHYGNRQKNRSAVRADLQRSLKRLTKLAEEEDRAFSRRSAAFRRSLTPADRMYGTMEVKRLARWKYRCHAICRFR